MSSSDRLPSLKGKRDLTLGGVRKKVYTPTIPVRRPKPDPSHVQASETPPTPAKAVSNTGKNPAARTSKNPTDKKKGRRQKELIMSASVFSMGPADVGRSQRTGGGGEHGGRQTTFGSIRGGKDRTKRSGQRDIESRDTLSSGEEEEGETDMVGRKSLFPSSLLPPVQLPLTTEEMDSNINNLKPHPQPLSEVDPLRVVVKEEPMDEDTIPVRPVRPVVKSEDATTDMTPSELFTPSEDAKGQFLFLQIPDCLPVQSTVGMPMDTDGEDQSITTPPNYGSLSDVPEGNIGQLRVHQSGRVTLLLGETVLDVSMATRGGFVQELVSIRTSDDPSSFSVLGHISHKLECVPNFNSLGLHGVSIATDNSPPIEDR